MAQVTSKNIDPTLHACSICDDDGEILVTFHMDPDLWDVTCYRSDCQEYALSLLESEFYGLGGFSQ